MATPAKEEGGCLLDTSSAKQDEVDRRRVRRSEATELPEDLAFQSDFSEEINHYLAPKMAVPMRTIVEPHSMAIS